MKRNICIFDIDGTLDLTNSSLSSEILKLSRRGVEFVTATGRVNSYVIATCKENNIIPPKFIIGDNGGTIYDTSKKIYLKRTTLKPDTRKLVLEEFVKNGGRLEDVRYTDGSFVYAAEDTAVRKYYTGDNVVQYKTNNRLFEEIMTGDADITKITLAGKKDLMKHINGFIKERDIRCWADMGKTKFPVDFRDYYRLDIMDGETCKGDAAKFLIDYTSANNFMCIGNGPNDFSMFQFALDSGMPVVVVRNFENGEVSKESEKLAQRVSEYAKKIGMVGNVTVRSFPINGYVGRKVEQSEARKRREGFVKGLSVTSTQMPSVNKIMRTKEIEIRKQDRGVTK